MKIYSLALAMCSSIGILSSWAEPFLDGRDPIQAKRLSVLFQEWAKEGSAWIRCSFSRDQDLLLNFGHKPTENFVINSYETRLIDRTTKLTSETTQQGELIHMNGDDATPWHINGTYIGGNHGCTSVIEIEVAEDALSVADIGSHWQDETGVSFYIIDLPMPGTARLLSENLAAYPIWKFASHINGSSLSRPSDDARLTFTKATLTQLWPCARIKEQKFLANGKIPLESGKAVECDFLDIVEEYDIINPASVLAEVIKHPGQRPNLTAAHLDGVLNNKILYRISPNASVVISHEALALQPFNLEFMGFIQQALLQKPTGTATLLRYYIPKTEPFQQDGTDYDFRAIQPFDEPPKSELRFNGHDSATHRKLPERFIQFLADANTEKHRNRVGLAFGYSLINGLTALENPAWQRNSAGFIYTSAKTYPFALDETLQNPVTAGTRFDCVAYRQYFDPSLQNNATSVFWHREVDKTIVYIDYHQPVKDDIIRLPKTWTGRAFRILEKTDSIKVDESPGIPSEGLKISCDREYGSLTFQISD